MMAWRDDIAERAANGDVDGVLKIYDELEADRQRVRAVNESYLAHIRELKGGKPAERAVGKHPALAAPYSSDTEQKLTGALSELRELLTAMGAPCD